MWLCPVKFLKVLSALQQCPLECEPRLPSSVVSPAAELRPGKVAGNWDPGTSDAAKDARNWKQNHGSEEQTSGIGKINERYC